MKLIMEFSVPEEQEQAAQAHLAPHAWAAIYDALEVIRSHNKHGAFTPQVAIERVRQVLADAQGRLE